MSGRGRGEAHARFEQRAAQVATERARRWLWAGLAALLVGGLVYLVGFSPVLTAETIAVSGADPADTKEVTSIASTAQGTPLARVSTGDLRRSIEELPGVESARVERTWPRTLTVDVLPRLPALAVQRSEGEVEVYDLDGVKIRTASRAPKGVPSVRAEEGATVSARGVAAARSMLDALPAGIRDRVTAVTVDAADHVSFRAGGTTVVWGDDSEPRLKVQVVELLLAKKPKLLDVSAPSTPVTR